jgi:uncharacterized protein (TIGR03083 family)
VQSLQGGRTGRLVRWLRVAHVLEPSVEDMTTRLSPAAYLDHLRSDGERLSTIGRTVDLTTAVPTCPGWTTQDLMSHCGGVWAYVATALRLGRAPVDAEAPAPPEGAAVLDFHDEHLRDLLVVLADRGPDEDTWTWFPGEQSTGFWFRRMAQEALVHRVDGELTAGELGPIDPVLAADGVDEVLSRFAGNPGVLAHSASRRGVAGEVYVDAGDHAFVVELPDDGHVVREVDPLDGGDIKLTADAVLRGAAMDLDLVLWGRPPTEPVVEEGDVEVLERLFSRLYLAASD